MPTHITPPPRASQTGLEAAESARRVSRFDERGIALQTIIIMVVLLAIAGAVAVVIANRAGQETDRLENVDTTLEGIDSYRACQLAGGVPYDNNATTPVEMTSPTTGTGVFGSCRSE